MTSLCDKNILLNMESFYDAPRRGLINFNSLQNVQIPALEVPEVSMISSVSTLNSPKYAKLNDNHLSYNAWKYRNQVNNTSSNPIASENSTLLNKKQVTFQPPKINIIGKSQTNINFHHENEEPKAPIKTLTNGNTLAQIYLSNIPKGSKKKIENSKTMNCPIQLSGESEYINKKCNGENSKLCEGLQSEMSDNVMKFQELQMHNSHKHLEAVIENKEPEPTVSDLMKIIQQQNDQLIKLQEQINELMVENRRKTLITSNSPVSHTKRKCQENGFKFNRMPKISLDVMTSFEVSIKAQKNYSQKLNKENISASKIQEINTVNQDFRDESLVLSNPLSIQERPISPERSIHVDMQDYSSDEESSTSSIGMSFYENVLGQVNNILHKKQLEKSKGSLGKVQESTFKHLRSLGVNIPIQETDEVDSTDSNNEEISFAVKQILMKYLPDEFLTKVGTKKVAGSTRKPDFSFATVQYLKKYNLLSENGNIKTSIVSKPTSKVNQANMQIKKILDITALKQQPKLM